MVCTGTHNLFGSQAQTHCPVATVMGTLASHALNKNVTHVLPWYKVAQSHP